MLSATTVRFGLTVPESVSTAAGAATSAAVAATAATADVVNFRLISMSTECSRAPGYSTLSSASADICEQRYCWERVLEKCITGGYPAAGSVAKKSHRFPIRVRVAAAVTLFPS
ncbi:hypothetical protein MAUB_06420 [Mycolicibacterium aubagnense]|uniref:Secreted protein n=1 Tax=Mycolicibacterium aubagnense TaxID=319707 RepID=A0ABM7I862_9MYCO|nr:hypothetical protein MAUB_06420 [Mycolicibacterium aubagnense]